MPKEPRVQAQATMRRQYGGQRTPGPSLVTVFGILLVAVSLVGVGAVVTLGSLRGTGSGTIGDGRAPDPTPTQVAGRATPIVRTVGPGAQATDGGPTPTTGGTGAPGLIPPSTSGGPLFAPTVPGGAGAQPPSSQQTGSPSPSSADGSPVAAPAADPQTAPSPSSSAPSPAPGEPLPIPPPLGSPTVAMSPAERAAAEAFARLTTDEEKVGQLLLLAWIGGTAEEARPALRDLKAGGIVHVQNTTSRAGATTINRGLNTIAAEAGIVRPLIAIDHEGGIVQRIKDVENLGNNWEFAAAGGARDLQACQRGLSHAEILRSMGFSMNLAPVLDVNNNPANPVIGRRSYSDDPEVVARLGSAYVRGLQGGGVAAVGKHFPGHGNTSTDSHLGLPSLPMSIADLERIELVPFRRAIEADIAGIMSAHILFPAVDTSGAPGTLSRPVMTGLLRERLGFRGLSVSDDMGAMKAITDNYTPGDAAVRAVQAGVDMIILSAEFPRQKQSRDALLAAVADGRISQDRLNEAVQHVLLVKARFGLLGEQAAQPGSGCS